MKIKDIEKLKNARNIINLLLEGINPENHEKIIEESFLNDPKMIRTFSYLALVLTQDIIEEEDEEENKNNLKFPSTNSKRILIGNSKITDNYKSINNKIKLSKIQDFNKMALSTELRKLAQLMEKDKQ